MSAAKPTSTPLANPDGDRPPVQLFGSLYGDSRRGARELRSNADTSSSPTTLLHETYLSLSAQAAAGCRSKERFMGYVARAMRSLIIDQVCYRDTREHGDEYQIATLPPELPCGLAARAEIERTEKLIEALEQLEPRLAECVYLQFFCGCSLDEIARIQQIPECTAQRDWTKARLLLYRQLSNTRQLSPTS